MDIEIIEDIDDENLPFFKRVKILLESINDWDENFNTVDSFINAIKDYLGGSLNLSQTEINEILAKKKTIKEAWRLESVSTLAKMLEENESLQVALDKLILDIKTSAGLTRGDVS